MSGSGLNSRGEQAVDPKLGEGLPMPPPASRSVSDRGSPPQAPVVWLSGFSEGPPPARSVLVAGARPKSGAVASAWGAEQAVRARVEIKTNARAK